MCGGIIFYLSPWPVDSRAFRLINAPLLTSQLPSLKLRRDVASLSLFYRYYFGRCSDELYYCVPGPKNWGRNTRLASASHEFCVEVGNPRIDRYGACFFPYTANLWNSLPPSVFPSSYNLSSFKSRVYKHLMDDWSISFLTLQYFEILIFFTFF